MSACKHRWVERRSRGSTYVACATCHQIPNGLAALCERDEARAEVRRLRRALGVYANPKTWGADEWGVRAVNLREYGSSGEIARRALARPTPKKRKSARRK